MGPSEPQPFHQYRCLQNIVVSENDLQSTPMWWRVFIRQFLIQSWASPQKSGEEHLKFWENVAKRTNPLSVSYFMGFQDCVTACPKNKRVKKKCVWPISNKQILFLFNFIGTLTHIVSDVYFLSFVFGLPYSRICSCYRFASFPPHLYVLSTAN